MYRCQSAHKLVELDAHFRLFARFHPRTVVDLAAAPGGFSQVALQCMQQHPPTESSSALLPPLVIAVDQRPIEPLQGLVVVRGNILQHRQVLQSVQHNLQSSPPATSHNTANGSGGRERAVEMILHDGVSVVKGQHAFSVTYAQNQMALSTLLLASKLFAQLGPSAGSSTARNHTQASTYTPPSSSSLSRASHERESEAVVSGQRSVPVCFISKVLRSPHLPQVLSATRALFRHVVVFKPPSSRAESQETYVVAAHFLPHHWQQLQAFTASPHRHNGRRGVRHTETRSRTPRSALHISPALFSMPPATEDCGAERHLVWNCLGCGRTCMGRQPCAHCGSFIPSQGRDNEN